MKRPDAQAYYLVVGPGVWGCWTTSKEAINFARREFTDSIKEWKAKKHLFTIYAVSPGWELYDSGLIEADEIAKLGSVADYEKL